MKKHLIILLNTLFLLLTNHAMENKQKSKKGHYSLCYQLKKIDSDAPYHDYEKLAQSFLDAKLSTCECTKHLIKEKKAKRLKQLRKHEIISDKQNEKIKKLQDNEEKELDHTPHLFIHLPPPAYGFQLNYKAVKPFIREVTTHFPNHSSSLNLDNEEAMCAASMRAILPKTWIQQNHDANYSHDLIQDHLFLGHYYFYLSNTSRRATLLHEKKHLTANHTPISKFLYKNLETKIAQPLPFKKHQAITRYRCSNEAEADRIPAACGDCNDAASFVDLFNEVSEKGMADPTGENHPTLTKRTLWARRIHTMKIAERDIVREHWFTLSQRNQNF